MEIYIVNTSSNDSNKAALTTFHFSLARRLIIFVAVATGVSGFAGAQENTSPNSVPQPTATPPARSNTISDDALLQEYERFKTAAGDKEYNVAHIMVADKNAAEQILDRLKKGEPFAELARVYSTDPSSAKKGGELGWNFPSSFTPNFALTLKSIEPGSYTTNPVRTPFGWHIIKINAVRPANLPSFEKVKESIRASLQAKQAK